jgi:hypothetical protein
MIRGTATQWKLILPHTKDEIQEIMIMFWQTGNPSPYLPIVKYKTDCRWDDSAQKECYVSLRPSETALFSDKYKAKMQLTVTPNNSLPFGIKEKLITVYPMPDSIIPDGPEFDPEISTETRWSYLDGGIIVED